MLKFVDLFCGMGSFHYSLSRLGMECVFASDVSEIARNNYEKNYKVRPEGDVNDIDPKDLPPYDVLCAGLPCQSFSNAGLKRGLEDDRGKLFFRLMKFVETNKPRFVVIENVSHLLKHDDGKTFETMKNALESEGYSVAHKILKCSDYGIPQMRKRLFVVCSRKEEEDLLDFFDLAQYEPKERVTLTPYLGKNFVRDFAFTIRCRGRHSKMGDRHNWSNYAVDGENYTITIEDALKLQGFSDYEMVGTKTQRWELLGNTIPTNLTRIIGKQILSCASKSQGSLLPSLDV